MSKAKHILESTFAGLQRRREQINQNSCGLESELEALRKEMAQIIKDQSDIYNAIKILADEEDMYVKN